jgi:hypothetical protein
MSRIILTRLLYSKDEVELSLLTALLTKQDLEVVYYWAYELYYSGFDVFELLWKIYLDFYYVKQPHFEVYFKKKHNLWKLDNNNMVYVAYILRNMYNLKATSTIFMLRQSINREIYPTIIYKYKYIPDWLNSYDERYHNLLISLKKRHLENICYHIVKLMENNTISDIIKNSNALPLYDMRVSGSENENESESESGMSLHYLLALIYNSLFENSLFENAGPNVNKKLIFIVPLQEHLDNIIQLEEVTIPLSKHGLPQIYNTLTFKRMVAIDDSIGSFKLARWNYDLHDNFVHDMWFNWEYYAMGSPVWFNRLEHFKGNINHETKKIEFATEQLREDFYDLYAFELDEQPKEVQYMSMKPLLKTSGNNWYNYIFNDMSDYVETKEDELWLWDY